MSRSDQYIGLNRQAELFINVLSEHFPLVVEDKYIMVSGNDTLCGDAISAKIVYVFTEDDPVNEYYILTELLQEIIWASGPMYFTHLNIGVSKKFNGQLVDLGDHFSWVHYPHRLLLDRNDYPEFDENRGIIYV